MGCLVDVVVIEFMVGKQIGCFVLLWQFLWVGIVELVLDQIVGVFGLIVFEGCQCGCDLFVVQFVGVQFCVDMQGVVVGIGVDVYQVFGELGVVLLVGFVEFVYGCFGCFGFDVVGLQFVG